MGINPILNIFLGSPLMIFSYNFCILIHFYKISIFGPQRKRFQKINPCMVPKVMAPLYNSTTLAMIFGAYGSISGNLFPRVQMWKFYWKRVYMKKLYQQSLVSSLSLHNVSPRWLDSNQEQHAQVGKTSHGKRQALLPPAWAPARARGTIVTHPWLSLPLCRLQISN